MKINIISYYAWISNYFLYYKDSFRNTETLCLDEYIDEIYNSYSERLVLSSGTVQQYSNKFIILL